MSSLLKIFKLFKSAGNDNIPDNPSADKQKKISEYTRDSSLICKMLAKLSIADGRLEPEELKYVFDEILPKICGNEQYALVRQDLAREFDDAIISERTFEDYVKDYVRNPSLDLKYSLEMLTELTTRDGSISENELKCLKFFAKHSNINDSELEKFLNELRELKGSALDMRAVYLMRLNSCSSDNFETITQNYKVLIKEYEDRLSSYCESKSLLTDYISYRKSLIEDAYSHLKEEFEKQKKDSPQNIS